MVRKINMAYDISVGIIDCILKRLARVGIQVGVTLSAAKGLEQHA
jgi:hypothetical protein